MATLPITSLLTGSSVPFLASGDLLCFVDISDLTQSVNGSTVKATVAQLFDTIPTRVTIQTQAVTAFVVGRQGATNPVLLVNTNTASCVTGISIVGAAAAGGLAITVTSSGTNEALTIDSKGTGAITFNGTATGVCQFGRDFGPLLTRIATIATNELTFNFATSNSMYHVAALAANSTIVISGNIDGHVYRAMIVDPNGKTLTMTTTVNWLGSALPSTAFTAGKPVVLTFWSLGTTLYGQWAQVV